jgi:DNA invertase Pin-like site-specific DNA recombinase
MKKMNTAHEPQQQFKNVYGVEKAAIYARKSREDQMSLEGQINECKEWAARKGITDYVVYVDEGSQSSEDWEREKFQEMLVEIKNYQFDMIIVVDQFRICRTEDFHIFKALLKEVGCKFGQTESGSISDFNNENDVLVAGVLTEIGIYQLTQLKKKLKRGTIQSAKSGNWLGKKTPVGYLYDREKKRLVKSKDAPVVKQIFELYMQGMSTKDIAYKFKNEKIETIETAEKMLWSPAGISRILNNVAYAGHTLYGKTTQPKIKGTKKRKTIKTDEKIQLFREETHTGIVTQEEWEIVQKLLTKKSSKPPALKHAKHTFSGLIRCFECDAVHSFQKSKGGKKRISSCQTRTYNDDFSSYTVCKNGGSNLEPFENIVFGALEMRVKQLEKYIDLINNTEIDEKKQQIKKESMKIAKEKQIEEWKRTIKNINKNLEKGTYLDEEEEDEKRDEIIDLKNMIKVLHTSLQKEDAEEFISESSAATQIMDKIKKFLSGRTNAFMKEEEKNDILSEFLEAIIYTKKGNEIFLKAAWKKDTDEIFKNMEKEIKEELA